MNYIDRLADELFQPMEIWRVEGVYASGDKVNHLVGAFSFKNAAEAALNADNRILKITSIVNTEY